MKNVLNYKFELLFPTRVEELKKRRKKRRFGERILKEMLENQVYSDSEKNEKFQL